MESEKVYYDKVNKELNINEALLIKLYSEDEIFIPLKSKTSEAGFDCKANIESSITLKPFSRATIPLGFGISIPLKFAGELRSKKNIMQKNGIVCGFGTISPGFKDEITATIFNFGDQDFVIEPKMEIAQMVIVPTVASPYISGPTGMNFILNNELLYLE